MTAAATASKSASAQLSFDFSGHTRTNNVVQLADHRKVPAHSGWTSELRETCQLFTGNEDAAKQLFEYLAGAIAAVSDARREGRDHGPVLQEFRARWERERA